MKKSLQLLEKMQATVENYRSQGFVLDNLLENPVISYTILSTICLFVDTINKYCEIDQDEKTPLNSLRILRNHFAHAGNDKIDGDNIYGITQKGLIKLYADIPLWIARFSKKVRNTDCPQLNEKMGRLSFN